MCGIVGIVADRPLENRDLLVAMRDTMCHRGPDDAGVWWSADGRVGLAHRRLSILDLSVSGHQPMIHDARAACIVFNGEIYNFAELREELRERGHVFRSAADTEVILAAYLEWGEDCLARLNGAFSFAIYDEEKRRLFAARDRAGEKPFFYVLTSGRLVFASELKAIMADPAFSRQLELESFEQYLAYGYVSGARCMLQGVRKLPAGHAMVYDLDHGALRIWRFWALPRYDETCDKTSESQLLDELESILADSVRRQLVADVPVGILLSGGIDSSLVTALASRASKQLKTFTVTFPSDGECDESPHARLVANHFGTDHTELPAGDASFEMLAGLARQCDEPIADHSIVPTAMLARLVGKHVKVALGGDGSDELFGGYLHYRWLLKLERLRRHVPWSLRHGVGHLAERVFPIGLRGRNHLLGFAGDTPASIASINLYFGAPARARLLRPLYGLANSALPEQWRMALCEPSLSPLQNALRSDFQTTLTDGYLVKVDRAGMLRSIEVRLPFLDYRVIEFAFGRVRDPLKATSNAGKLLLRSLARRLLPPSLDLERKHGLSLPLERWLKGSWGDYITGVLKEAPPNIFDREEIARLLKGQRRGLRNANRLFALAMFELWRREYRVGVGSSR